MYIFPNSSIRILQNIPLSSDYRNTILFTSNTDQQAFFYQKSKYILENYSYIRPQQAIRVGFSADNLYDCNYLMFQNSSYGLKWFYAFITDIIYINNDCAEIRYELDVLQTWMLEWQMHPCFVVREHSVTDTPGSNLVPEGLETGDYVSDGMSDTGYLSSQSILITATFDSEMQDSVGAMRSGIYSGLTYHVFDTFTAANEFITAAVGAAKSDGIVSVSMLPTEICTADGTAAPNTYEVTIPKTVTSLGSYTPRNKKLLTYPYNFLYCTNLSGVSAEFHYEYFSSDACYFYLTGDMSPNPQILLAPKNYKGVDINYNERMILEGFPQCAFTTNSYEAWLAQNAGANIATGFSIAAGALRSGADIGAGVASARGMGKGSLITPEATGASTGLLSRGISELLDTAQTAGNYMAQRYDRSRQPPQASGSTANSVLFADDHKNFYFQHMHITEEFAAIIDGYFDLYGYATNALKVPNLTSRPHWNYVKTMGCNITGNIPAGALAQTRSIFDTGITFWKNGNEVGNYSLDNGV